MYRFFREEGSGCAARRKKPRPRGGVDAGLRGARAGVALYRGGTGFMTANEKAAIAAGLWKPGTCHLDYGPSFSELRDDSPRFTNRATAQQIDYHIL
jgi:hypothetical protein